MCNVHSETLSIASFRFLMEGVPIRALLIIRFGTLIFDTDHAKRVKRSWRSSKSVGSLSLATFKILSSPPLWNSLVDGCLTSSSSANSFIKFVPSDWNRNGPDLCRDMGAGINLQVWIPPPPSLADRLGTTQLSQMISSPQHSSGGLITSNQLSSAQQLLLACPSPVYGDDCSWSENSPESHFQSLLRCGPCHLHIRAHPKKPSYKATHNCPTSKCAISSCDSSHLTSLPM